MLEPRLGVDRSGMKSRQGHFLGVRRVVPCRVFDSGRGWIPPLNARHSSLCPGLAQGSLQPAEGWRWGPREPNQVKYLASYVDCFADLRNTL